jgi:hypothetical protein
MAKPLNDILKGVKKSTVVPGSTGKDPGVDYMPKAGDEQKFVALHKTEKHANRAGNKEDVLQATNVKYSLDTPQNARMGNNEKKSKADYFTTVKEGKEAEDAQCNNTPKGKSCPVHGMNECWSAKKITEDAAFKDALPNIIKDIKAKKSAQELRQTHGSHYKRIANAASNVHGPKYTRAHLLSTAQTAMKEEVELDEVLTKKTPAGEWIKDFQKSEKSQFAGKSKEKRKQMALAAYYSKQREGVKEDLAMPLLGGDMKPRGDSDEAAEMVKAELKALANKAMHLVSQMPDSMHVEPWVQAKIAQAKSMVSDVHDYCIYGNHENEEMTDNTGASGGSAGGALVMNQMDTPMTFPNMSVDVNTGQNV